MTYNFYEWWGDLDAIHVRFPARHFKSWFMVEGRPVVGWDEGLLATYSSDDLLASNFGLADNSWPVCSRKMRGFLEKRAPGLVQYLPFRLKKLDSSRRLNGYCVCQVLRAIDCLDRKRTKVRKNWEPINDDGDFETVRPIVVSRRLIGDEYVFRIKGMCRSIVIREDLKDAIEDAGFKEQRFDLLECSE